MSKVKILQIHKTPLLLSATLSIILIAIRVEKNPLGILFILAGSFLGTFILDLDYIIQTYFLEPGSPFSKTVAGYIKDKDPAGALGYIVFHRNDIKEKALNSALFQVVLAGLSLFIISSNAGLLIKSIVISTFLNSIYRFAEAQFEGKTQEWFWNLNIELNRQGIAIYSLILLGGFVYCLSIF